MGSCFLYSLVSLQNCSFSSLLFFCSSALIYFNIMNTYHAALWSSHLREEDRDMYGAGMLFGLNFSFV